MTLVHASLRSVTLTFTLAASLGAVSIAGCGGAEVEVARPGPFTAEDAQVFDDGVDFVADPEALEGRWRRDWADELDARITRANIVAVVSMRSVSQDSDLDRRMSYRLNVQRERGMLGQMPEEVLFRTSEGDTGFGTVDGNQDRLLQGEFIAFIKWASEEGRDDPVAKWHLSPNSDQVLRRVEYLLQRRRGATGSSGRTVVHEH